MSRRTFKYTPKQLQTLLETNRFAFLSHAAREKIDALMEAVSFDYVAYQKDRDVEIRWFALPEAEKEAASHRFAVCCAVYCLMVDGMSEKDAIRYLLERSQLAYRNSGIRKDWQQAVRALSLLPDFTGIRSVTCWNERLEGVPQGSEQYLALVPDEVIAASQDAYLAYAMECKANDRA